MLVYKSDQNIRFTYVLKFHISFCISNIHFFNFYFSNLYFTGVDIWMVTGQYSYTIFFRYFGGHSRNFWYRGIQNKYHKIAGISKTIDII